MKLFRVTQNKVQTVLEVDYEIYSFGVENPG